MLVLNPKFKRLENKKRYTLLYGGRGSAKSFHANAYLLHKTFTLERQVILFTRYTMASANMSVIPEFREKMMEMQVEEMFKSKGDTLTNVSTNTQILFAGIIGSRGNQTARLKSIPNVGIWVLDEAEEMINPREFDRIDRGIRRKGFANKVILIFNTDRIDQEHWIYKRFFQAGERDDTEYIKVSYLDNLRHLDDSFINQANRLKEENPEEYAIEYMGGFAQLRDKIYGPYEVFDDPPEDYDWFAIGGDFGFSDNPAAAVAVWKAGEHLYLKELLYERGLTNQAIAERLAPYAGEVQIWDSAEKKSILELRLGGINAFGAKKGPGSVNFGIKKLQELKVHIHRESANLQHEWGMYRWKKALDGEYIRNAKGDKVPVMEDDHLLDAVRYVLTNLTAWG